MLDLVFDCSHEAYLMHHRPEALTITQTLLYSLKMFVNIFALAVVFTLPIALMLILAMVLDGKF